jgi:hypothetical protein
MTIKTRRSSWELDPRDIAEFCRIMRISRGATSMWLKILEHTRSGTLRCSAKQMDEAFGFNPSARNAALHELEIIGAIQRYRDVQRGQIEVMLLTPVDFHCELRFAREAA